MKQLKHNFNTVDDGFRHVKKEMNDKEKSITHYISSGDSNRYGQILPIEGFQENEYRKNPIVMFQHGTSDMFVTTPAKEQLDFLIGKNLWTKPDGNYLLVKTQFADTELANDIYMLNKGGFLNAWSKYWYPISDPEYKDGFLHVAEWGIYEYSSVLVPVDSNAVNDLDVNKNMLSMVHSDKMKNFLVKNTVEKTVEVNLQELIKPLQEEINLVKESAKNNNENLKKEIDHKILNSIKVYNKTLLDTVPGIVGDKIVDAFNKNGLNNIDNKIKTIVAGAIKDVMGRV